MKRWNLTYELSDQYSEPVNRHSYSLRCFPREMTYQKIYSCSYEVRPCSGSSRGRDSFGNPLIIGCCREPHGEFLVRVHAVVQTEGRPEPEEAKEWQLGMYRYGTEYTQMGAGLEEFYESLGNRKCGRKIADTIPESGEHCGNRSERGPERGTLRTSVNFLSWDRAAELMRAVSNVFVYERGVTTFYTTAEEAFALGRGVCQDYAHILLALCRREGLTARYVAGAIPGEGESHGWVEVWQDGFWKGFDPTNNRETDEDYIRFAVGRDAHDCCLNQGIFWGRAMQLQQVRITMVQLDM